MKNPQRTPAVSVIVPVYNAEKWLRRCIDSILGQTTTDFELLLIDDGSTDASGSICDGYAAQDARVRAFHKENGGVSSARNLGLDKAEGEYIAFVDADDRVDPDYLEAVASDLPEGDGFTTCGMRTWDGLRTPQEGFHKADRIEGFLQLADGLLQGAPFSKSFSKALIDRHRIRFDERLSFGEDHQFNLEYLFHCDYLLTRARTPYRYNYTIGGLSKRNLGFKNLYNHDLAVLQYRDRIPLPATRSLFDFYYFSLNLDALRFSYLGGFSDKEERLLRLRRIRRIMREHPRTLKGDYPESAGSKGTKLLLLTIKVLPPRAADFVLTAALRLKHRQHLAKES